jgi:hypothetical protein
VLLPEIRHDRVAVLFVEGDEVFQRTNRQVGSTREILVDARLELVEQHLQLRRSLHEVCGGWDIRRVYDHRPEPQHLLDGCPRELVGLVAVAEVRVARDPDACPRKPFGSRKRV